MTCCNRKQIDFTVPQQLNLVFCLTVAKERRLVGGSANRTVLVRILKAHNVKQLLRLAHADGSWDLL